MIKNREKKERNYKRSTWEGEMMRRRKCLAMERIRWFQKRNEGSQSDLWPLKALNRALPTSSSSQSLTSFLMNSLTSIRLHFFLSNLQLSFCKGSKNMIISTNRRRSLFLLLAKTSWAFLTGLRLTRPKYFVISSLWACTSPIMVLNNK